ncbi:tetratricopeptide repeat protein [Litchfieldia salsa]|uniref:Tetratricopeptide repeat-containing protein n=1 Tax=Litchfieldia salsa TaxID=930152 RepID=A0A1H0NW84_9BACI|nr:tetratricopeptide repeat protein [Litchfieldia salsa]SDO96909.1 Tetratricopeptide repeat-containing protein [Litchfieldia salsa]
MSNQNNEENHKATVIQFPKLKERLIEKGLEALKSKNYKDALSLLYQAKELAGEHDEIDLGIVLCLLELGDLEEAKDRCKLMLHHDIGDYFNVLQVYLTILIQLRQYQEVKETIEAVLEEDQVPSKYAESFYQLLELSKKMIISGDELYELDVEDEESVVEYTLTERIQDVLLDRGDRNEQAVFVHGIKEYSLHKDLELLNEFLGNPSKDPMIKTLLLQLMMEQNIHNTMVVEKFGQTVEVVPAKMGDILTDDYSMRVLRTLEDQLGNENPTLYEVTKEIWMRVLFILFPFIPEEENSSIWSAALHLYGYELHGIEIENSELEELYGVTIFELKQAIDKIQKLEEISYLYE